MDEALYKERFEDDYKYINNCIEKYLPRESGLQKSVIEAMNYSVKAGGKRLRPMLILESYRLCNGKNNTEIEPFMAAMEFIHTYSLVHDDLPILDNDDYRRGMLTTHKKFGAGLGLLSGDGLLNYAYEILFKAILGKNALTISRGLLEDSAESEEEYTIVRDEVKFLKRRTKACACLSKKAGIYGMIGGQTLDVELTDNSVNEEQLDFIFKNKTGALIESAMMIGGILAGADDETVSKLEKIGLLIGFAFQIRDDVLDVISDTETLGKPVLSDERNNKTTYVTLYGIDKSMEDVAALTAEAVDLIKEIGDNEFLLELVDKLINRDK